MTEDKKPFMPAKAGSEEWETPPEMFDPLNKEFKFNIDAAASGINAKCDHFFSKHSDAINTQWPTGARVWLNPPYSQKMLEAFSKKAVHECIHRNCTTVMLVPVKADQAWWHNLWDFHSISDQVSIEYRWIKGRVRFMQDGVPCKNTIMVPCCIIVIKPMGDGVASW